MDCIFIDKNLEELRSDIFGKRKFLFKRLDDQCSRYPLEQLPEEHPPKSTTYMGIAIANLSLAYLLTKQEHYLTEAKRWMDTVVSYPHWGNAHLVDVDLSAAWILFGLSLGYDWLREDLTEDEEKRIREKLILQGDRMYKFKVETEGSGWSTNYWQNHNWINLTGLASAGYALRSGYAYAKDWIECAKDNFKIVYDVMADDGSDYEGVVYWRYGAMWLFVYAHLLKEREGIDYFRSSGFLENTFYYRLYQAAPNLEEQINFGDCHDRRSGHSTAIYYKVAAEYKNGHAQKIGNLVVNDFLYREAMDSEVKPGILPEVFFEMIFYDPEVEEEAFETLPLQRYFEDLGLLVVRDSWERDAAHLSFKCGHPGGKQQWKKLWELKKEKNYNCFGLSHHHPDNNSFILHANGKFMAIDDGYNRTVKASDHNVVIVDGKGFANENQNNVYKNYEEDMVGEIEKIRIEPSYTYIVGETSGTYDKELKLTRNARHILTTGKGYFIILDELDSEEEHQYSWQMHGDVFPRIDGQKLTYENGLSCMDMISATPYKTSFEKAENRVRAVMTTQEPDKFRETIMKTLKIHADERKKRMEFLNVLVPYPLEEQQTLEVNPISSEEGFGVEVIDGESKEVFIYSSKGTSKCETKLFRYQNEELIEVIEL